MDLGLKNKTALVCAASKGLGLACAESLAREGVTVYMVARSSETLELAAARINQQGHGQAFGIVADITTDAGRATALQACPSPDILLTNAGGPPAGNFRKFARAEWLAAIEANMLTPIFLIQAVIDGMIDRGFGRILNITSGAVKMPGMLLPLSNGARGGLTAFVGGLAREVASKNVTVNNLLPGLFSTDRLSEVVQGLASQRGITLEAAMTLRRDSIPAGRFGIPAELGDLCAYLASAQAGFITGQNLLIDGGAYPGTW